MVTPSPAKLILMTVTILGIAAVGLLDHRASESAQVEMVDSGSWYSREQWPHDGHPYETEHFVVYSDAASLKARASVARVCEEIFEELTAEFELVPDEMFRYPRDQEKIDIYAYKEHYPHSWGARAYYAGLIIWSLDHTERSRNRENYKRVVKHELTHVVEALLKGRDVAHTPVSIRVHMWFSEGLAEAMCGGTSGPVVRDRSDLNRLTAEFGRISPVTYATDSDVGDYSDPQVIRAYVNYVYPVSQLAVEYLMDPDGLGKSPREVVAVFTDIADGMTFADAFARRTGMSLEEYDEGFFDLMDRYLPEQAPAERLVKLQLLGALLAVGGAVALLLGSILGATSKP